MFATHSYIAFRPDSPPGHPTGAVGVYATYMLYGVVLALYLVANFGSFPTIVSPELLEIAFGI